MKCQRARRPTAGKAVGRLLDVVLADDPDARVDGLEDLGRGPGLGRGDELDSGRQLRQDGLDVGGDLTAHRLHSIKEGVKP